MVTRWAEAGPASPASRPPAPAGPGQTPASPDPSCCKGRVQFYAPIDNTANKPVIHANGSLVKIQDKMHMTTKNTAKII
jgi:hypothetical protein